MSAEERNPAEEAREALRAARAGGSGAADPDAGRAASEAAPAERGVASAAAREAEQRPGDAARAALGARPGDEAEVPEAEDRPGETAAEPGARPGEVARAALRAAVAARREGEAPSEEADADPDEPAAPAASQLTPTSPRPGDAAREALRAARREADRGERRPRKTTPRPAPAPAEGHSAHAQVARDMRNFLSTAFRMPDLADDPEAEAQPRTDTPEPPTEHAPTPPAPGTAPTRTPDHPAPPHHPSSMATPHRDSELRRTFPPFAPRPEPQDFATTWWGQAWVDALEHTALDVNRLARGRGYADAGNVDAITVTPGLVLAYVRGSRPRPYRVQLRLRRLGEEDWERLLEAAVDSPADIAALLDKELPHTLADRGVPLLPGPGDLIPQCSCPDSGRPCKHAAALCYQTARLLDADPFVLLLLRGRGERELLDTLSRRSAASAARAARERGPAALPGVRASEALAGRPLPPLPAPLPAPVHPEAPPAYPAAPGGPDPFALDQLATDAAARAHALLTTGRDPVGGLTLWQDAVRLAAARPGSGLTAATRSLYATLAAAVDRTPAELARAVAAWRQGGFAGLRVLEESWDPPAGRFDRARPLLLAADLPAFRPWRNHLTHPAGHAQLRLGQDGLWYAYESEPGRQDWWPRGAPDLDPVSALTTLDIPDSL
ncbi:SWIM zinc finger family protein [Streptomyces sp. NPDC027717]|uniref:SWIM zinc finger family protein n=1 Tax=Streptomyces sp. NPDC027717 TaxID=3155765 RepID=UPI003404C34B